MKAESTGGRGRTDTPLREQDFESSASANFATPAEEGAETTDGPERLQVPRCRPSLFPSEEVFDLVPAFLKVPAHTIEEARQATGRIGIAIGFVVHFAIRSPRRRIAAIVEISAVITAGVARRTIELPMQHRPAIGGDGHQARPTVTTVEQLQLPNGGSTIGAAFEPVIHPVKEHVCFLRLLIGDGEGAFGIEIELVEIHRAARDA